MSCNRGVCIIWLDDTINKMVMGTLTVTILDIWLNKIKYYGWKIKDIPNKGIRKELRRRIKKMKVRCLNCGLVLEKCLSLECVCPECGRSNWGVIIDGSEEKIDKESLEIMKDLAGTYKVAKEWLEGKGYMYSEKMGVPTMMEATMKARAKIEKEEGLAFEIFEVEHSKVGKIPIPVKVKINVRKIYFDGHIEGFKGDPCVINHIAPKIMALKAILRQMNKDYRDFIERPLIADLPIDLIDLSKLYQSQLKRINNIKL